MATPKATKTAPAAPAAPATTAAPKVSAEEKGKNDKFIRVFGEDKKPVAPATKLAPQAQCIVNTIEASGKDGVSRQDLVKNLTGVLVTRQPVGRIVSYYQKTLIESGAVKMVPSAPVAEEAAK